MVTASDCRLRQENVNIKAVKNIKNKKVRPEKRINRFPPELFV
jgi:hypothetical protein